MIIYLILISLFIYNYFEPYITYTKCNNMPLGRLIDKIFNKYNIKKYNNGIIYLPCGYNKVETELRTMNYNSKYIFGLSGCDKIVSKNNIWSILNHNYHRDMASKIMPESYVTNNSIDLLLFKKRYIKNRIYILKKNLQRKKGILLTRDYNTIINSHKHGYKVIQTYITDTLLINNRKINLRIYLLLIASRGKLEGYIHNLGKCIYTNKDYNDNDLNFENNITSYNLDMKIYDNSPFTLDELRTYLRNRNKNPNILFKNIDIQLNKTLHACDKYLGKLEKHKYKTCFQLFGVDFIITPNLYPYLLEFNKGPDMIPKNNRDEILKTIVLEDIFKKLNLINNKTPNGYRRIY